MVEIQCLNNNKKNKYPKGVRLTEIIKDMKLEAEYPFCGAYVNNKLKELSYEVYKPKQVEFINITHHDGMRMYIRSLSFVLQKTVKDLFPDAVLQIQHSVSKGLYCELENLESELDIQMVLKIGKRMREIINFDFIFKRTIVPTKEAVKLFEDNFFTEKAKLFETRSKLYTSVYELDGDFDYYYGYLVPSTGFLKVFDLVKYYDGMLLMIPKRSNPNKLEELVLQDQMFTIFQEHKRWVDILGIASICNVNKMGMKGKGGELIKISEALHEKKVVEIANKINERRDEVRIILISGPSSSGKTTFAKRLAVQLKVAELKPVLLSLDNYFVNREHTPLDENGDYDYEVLNAIDVELFNSNINDLLEGKEVNLPKFSFQTGKRFYDNDYLKITNENIIIVEGIHALNPGLTKFIEHKFKFKIYISALTQIGIDRHNRIPTTDNRLIRRIVRDFKYRGYSAHDTISRWESVRKGEDQYIFPFQEEADVMFNSSLVYELGILKNYAEPLLKQIPENKIEYAESLRLLKLLSYFIPINEENEIPPTSILREFLEGSSFDY